MEDIKKYLRDRIDYCKKRIDAVIEDQGPNPAETKIITEDGI